MSEAKPKRRKVKITTAYTPVPWRAAYGEDGAIVEAYIRSTDGWKVVAVVPKTGYADHKANAEFIVNAVNVYGKHRAMIAEMIMALELCLEYDRLPWDAEQEASVVCRNAKELV